MLSNRGANPDTSQAWSFYHRVREQFGDWNHVILTFPDEPDRIRGASEHGAESKIVQFVDDQGNTLELDGINFGYDGGTPHELLAMLLTEGFDDGPGLHAAVLNPAGENVYPRTIARD
ncbi:hypothetical protein MUNTM_51220 [Mycobacterium sp. MUNTM1]